MFFGPCWIKFKTKEGLDSLCKIYSKKIGKLGVGILPPLFFSDFLHSFRYNKLVKKILISKNPEETMNFAFEVAKDLRGGEVLALQGDLGAGKTTFTKGLAEALKVNETITSPTFVILKSYDAILPSTHLQGVLEKVKLVHIDAYRCDSIEDIKSVGIEDYLGRDDVIMVVEWPEKIQELLPEDTINIVFKSVDEKTREINYDFND